MNKRNLTLATGTMLLVVGVSGCFAPEKQAPVTRDAESVKSPAVVVEAQNEPQSAAWPPAPGATPSDAARLRTVAAPRAERATAPAEALAGASMPVLRQKRADAALGRAAGSGRMPSPSKPAASVTALAAPPALDAPFDTEAYAAVEEGGFLRAREHPLSTFSIDVDTASYSNVRRFLNQGSLPPAGAVRIEELINYFPFDYPAPESDEPCSVSLELSQAPWNEQHQLLRVGVQAKRVDTAQLPPQNLVFLLDVSGSMSEPNKLPLLKRSLVTLAENLREQDSVAIAVYAGASGLVLPPTSGANVGRIVAALEGLEAGGSTNGGEGIELAYAVAERMAAPGEINRVILATDGDFNVGVSSHGELVRLIEQKRRSGVFLSVLGFGMGNLKDSTLELLADKGNGNYAYIDSLAEAKKVLVSEAGGTFLTLAKDVKIQIEFNPGKVGGYRLIGYDNRRLDAQDFNDDAKDAGELGAGHSVTALYELVPPGAELSSATIDALKYQTVTGTAAQHGDALATFKLRYKAPSSEHSQLLARTIVDRSQPLAATSDSFRFAAAVATFGMALKGSAERGSATFELARALAQGAVGSDPQGYRRELVGLVERADALARGSSALAPTISRSP